MPRPSKTSTHCRTVRTELGLTQSEFAKAFGFSRSYINRIECGGCVAGKLFAEQLMVIEHPPKVHELIAKYRTELMSPMGNLAFNRMKFTPLEQSSDGERGTFTKGQP